MMCECGHAIEEHGDRAVVACTAFTVVKKMPGPYGGSAERFVSCNCTGWKAR